jgi:predicted nucleotidyltransferase
MNRRRETLEEICRKFGIVTLYSFGSQAQMVKEWLEDRREDIPKGPSDVDMGVRGIPGNEWLVLKKVQLAGALEDYFDCVRIELVILKEADPFLAAEIIRGERLFALDEREADEYELYILRRAGDLAPLERERMALVLGEPA